MKNRKNLIQVAVASVGMLFVIFDTKTAVNAAYEGIELCLHTVIPSLFPFIILSGVINSCLIGRQIHILRPLGRLCNIPNGAESLLILGFLAGYPIGAQLIAQSYRDGRLSLKTARRMLGFCNNAGPAFIFGMLSPLFSSVKVIIILWFIQMISALITGFVLPIAPPSAAHMVPGNGISLAESLQKALWAIATVSGWVVLFRIIIGFCNRWFLWRYPVRIQILISGIFELANGCALLNNLPSEGVRFLISGILLSFGGLCVGMQTISVTAGLGTGWYFPGKIFQTTLTGLICLLLQPILFSRSEAIIPALAVTISLSLFLIFIVSILHRKKVVAFWGRLLYNTNNNMSKGA